MSERLDAHRQFYGRLVTANAGVPLTESLLADAFAAVAREKFLGPGPWKAFTPAGYIETPGNDAALLYQDITVAIAEERHINNGQPTLHAACLAALTANEGETVVHVGAGTGYYTAILAHLVGPMGSVTAYELETDLAARAAAHLAYLPQAKVVAGSGSAGTLPECDVLYVNAGATGPAPVWLDALRPGGRLLFPLSPVSGFGAMLLITQGEEPRIAARFAARFVCHAKFIPCVGAIDGDLAVRLAETFRTSPLQTVKSLVRGEPADDSCWFDGGDWWLSTVA